MGSVTPRKARSFVVGTVAFGLLSIAVWSITASAQEKVEKPGRTSGVSVADQPAANVSRPQATDKKVIRSISMQRAEGDTDKELATLDFDAYQLLWVISPSETGPDGEVKQLQVDLVVKFDKTTGTMVPWGDTGTSPDDGSVTADAGGCTGNACGGACCAFTILDQAWRMSQP